MVRRLAHAAHPAAGQAFDQHVGWHVDVDGLQDSAAALWSRRFERLRLGQRARKAVEQSTARGVGLVQPMGDHVHDDVVGHQITTVHVLLRGAAEGRAPRAVVAQQFAAGDVRHA